MTSETLLLKLRAETLQSNLSRLQICLETPPERLTDLGELWLKLDEARKAVQNSRRAMVDLDDVSGMEAIVAKVTDEMARVSKTLSLSMDIVKQMERKCFSVNKTLVGGDIAALVKSEADPLVAKMNGIRSINGVPLDPGKSWEDLRVAATSKTEAIFTSSVELLGGAALRDSGLDERIGLFADQLLAMANDKKLLALPTGQASAQQELARVFKGIIRVAFPDWTLWSLPAAALEYWKISYKKTVEPTLNANLANLTPEERDAVREDDTQPLVDAYATYIMGPAYACYAIGVLLAPESDTDQLRVRFTLTMLDAMSDAVNPSSPPFVAVSRRLLEGWNAARIQMGRVPLVLDGPVADQDPETVRVRMIVRIFRNTLETITAAKFGMAIWNDIQPWVDLLNQEGGATEINVPQGADLRHVLNAIWLARISPDRDPQSDLTESAKILLERFKEIVEKGKK